VKIVFVNRFYAPDHSATSQMLTDLAGSLAAEGADIHVVASRLRYDQTVAPLRETETIDGV
jgi:colanic acid biosynthesis glycosyl transferase WcaI